MVFNFYISVLLIAVLGIALSLIFRRKIARRFGTEKPYRYYLFFALILIIIEEFVNCSPSQGCLPWITVPILFVYVLVFGLIIRKLPIKSVFLGTLLFSVIGLLLEFFVYGNKDLSQYNTFETVFILVWVGLSYAFLVIVPLTILFWKRTFDK